MPILSAAPSAADRARAEHRLYGFRDAADPCSAADWAALARNEISALHDAGQLPILVGGTGLYLRTLIEGIAPVPPIDPNIRAEIREAPPHENRRRLEASDPQAAERINLGDRARTARSLEVVLSTGRTLAEWQAAKAGGIGDGIDLRALILLPPRDWLYPRCDRRFAEMVEAGAVEEVRSLLDRKLDPALPAMRAIGVSELAAFLSGDKSLQDALTAGQQATRNYAKRQYTWFAHQPPHAWPRFRESLDERSAAAALELLGAKA